MSEHIYKIEKAETIISKDSPRTDSQNKLNASFSIDSPSWAKDGEYVHIDFARELERENIMLRMELQIVKDTLTPKANQ